MTRIGATLPTSAFAVAQQARANAEQARNAADRMRAQAEGQVEPAFKLVETPAEIRDQVMSERGVDRLDLLRMGPQARLEAEISIEAESRARQAKTRVAGAFIDLKA